eukprot:2686598-Amphidinium_carterae.1
MRSKEELTFGLERGILETSVRLLVPLEPICKGLLVLVNIRSLPASRTPRCHRQQLAETSKPRHARTHTHTHAHAHARARTGAHAHTRLLGGGSLFWGPWDQSSDKKLKIVDVTLHQRKSQSTTHFPKRSSSQ